jgi:predicted MFS family arabinose efflux permease
MLGLAAVGVFWGAFSVYIPDFQTRVGADDAQLGRALMMSAAGSIVAMWIGPILGRWLGRLLLPVSGLFLCLSAWFPVLAGSLPGLALALLAMGGSVALLDIGSNIRITNLEERHGLHLMNLNHAVFSFAFAATALFSSLLRAAGWGPEDLLALLAPVLALLALVTIERTGWHSAPPTPQGADNGGLWQRIAPGAAILFVAFVCENATDNWSALHLERTLGSLAGLGGLGPMMLGLTMGIGRLSGQVVAQRLGEERLIFWTAVVGVAGAVVTALAPTPAVALIGIGLVGLGVAVTVPSANSIIGRLVRPDQRGLAISRAWIAGFTGFFIGPAIMGQIADLAGLRTAFLWVALMLALILPSVIWIRRLGRSEKGVPAG